MTMVLKNMKMSKNQQENHQFFKVFEITRTGSSLIPNFFQRIKTWDSLLLEHLKNQNQQFLKIQRTTQHLLEQDPHQNCWLGYIF